MYNCSFVFRMSKQHKIIIFILSSRDWAKDGYSIEKVPYQLLFTRLLHAEKVLGFSFELFWHKLCFSGSTSGYETLG